MPLKYKPDFERVKTMWNAFWHKEVPGRPLVWAEITKPGKPSGRLTDRYWHAVQGDRDYTLKQIDLWLEETEFLGESIPYYSPDYGPDQFAAFLGAEFHFSEGSGDTDWVSPIVEDWDAFLPLRLDPENKYWKGILEYSRLLAAHSDGRYLVSVADLHSNMDTLLALRGSERLCMDFYDHPHQVEEAMRQVRACYQPIYNGLYEAGAMGGDRGSMVGWARQWCNGRFSVIQCDFLALMSPELSRRYVIPALEEEASFLDRCVYHLDGPGCLPHLDDILSIKDIDVIQWVSGAGKPPMHEWMDVLKKCQAAGKSLQLFDIRDLDTVKRIACELRPEGLLYCLDVQTREEALTIIKWLEKNT